MIIYISIQKGCVQFIHVGVKGPGVWPSISIGVAFWFKEDLISKLEDKKNKKNFDL